MSDIDPSVVDLLVNKHYDALKSVARAKRRGSRSDVMLLTTDLLHETWFKLRKGSEWTDEAHFLRTCAVAMRQVIIDSARKHVRTKRGGGVVHEDFEDWQHVLPDFSETPEELLVINDLIEKLQSETPELAEIVDLRYFGGFTESETAKILDTSERTVRRKWKLARAWLATEMV